jgi:alpha-glucuronidase
MLMIIKFFPKIFFTAIILLGCSELKAEDGYRLWLRYDLVSDPQILNQYNKSITGLIIEGESPTIRVARKELEMGLNGLLGREVPSVSSVTKDGIIIAGTPQTSSLIASLDLKKILAKVDDDGYIIINTNFNRKKVIVIAANNDAGVLYGTFHFLRQLQMQKSISELALESSPRTKIRLLNHWDNLNRTVERGYAGRSLWDWESLPGIIDQRYTDYARANASIGINGTVLTNVNANALILTKDYLVKVAALASVFRPYGIKVYLTARFSAPVEIGKLKTADPLDAEVID